MEQKYTVTAERSGKWWVVQATDVIKEAITVVADAAEEARLAARELSKAGITLRDIGELIGVSFQRAGQLVKYRDRLTAIIGPTKKKSPACGRALLQDQRRPDTSTNDVSTHHTVREGGLELSRAVERAASWRLASAREIDDPA